MPDMPAPMTTTWNGLSGLTSSLCHRGARRSAVSASSSRIIGRYSSISCPPARYWRIRVRSGPVGIGAVTLPPSRNATSVSSASARTAACCSGVSPPWSSIISDGSMRSSGRSSDRSPVTWARAGSSAGRSATSSAGAQLVVGGGDRLDRTGQGHGVPSKCSSGAIHERSGGRPRCADRSVTSRHATRSRPLRPVQVGPGGPTERGKTMSGSTTAASGRGAGAHDARVTRRARVARHRVRRR